jgi:hypothetical protein
MEAFFEISDNGNIVKVEVLNFIWDSGSDWDRNWVKSKVTIKAGRFSGEYEADLRTVDFIAFEKQFSALYDNLNGAAAFHDIERYLDLRIIGDGIGHFEIDVTANDNPGSNPRELTFTMNIDQTFIKPIVKQVKGIIEQFPLIGTLN